MLINGPKALVKRAAFVASFLGLNSITLTLQYSEDGSQCTANNSGTFTIDILRGLSKRHLIEHVAHEMVHLRQFKHDQLAEPQIGVFYWQGEKQEPQEFMSDEYFLCPWEMEARALEGWIAHHWEIRRKCDGVY